VPHEMRFEAFAAAINTAVSWDMPPCSLVIDTKRFGGTCRSRLQGRTLGQLLSGMFTFLYQSTLRHIAHNSNLLMS
jgi:hypothetical protein